MHIYIPLKLSNYITKGAQHLTKEFMELIESENDEISGNCDLECWIISIPRILLIPP